MHFPCCAGAAALADALRLLAAPPRAHAQLRRLLRANDWASNADLPNLPARHPLLTAIVAGHEPVVALLLK
jgi:hypothetical protein